MDEFIRILESLLAKDEIVYTAKVNSAELDMSFNSIEEIANHITNLEIEQELYFEFYKDGEKVGEYTYEPKCTDDDDECEYDCTDDDEIEVFSFEREFDDYRITINIERI